MVVNGDSRVTTHDNHDCECLHENMFEEKVDILWNINCHHSERRQNNVGSVGVLLKEP